MRHRQASDTRILDLMEKEESEDVRELLIYFGVMIMFVHKLIALP